MVDIDTFTNMVEQVVSEIPAPYLDGLNGGVLVLEESRQHESAPDGTLVLGEYVVRPWLGSHVVVYYGSFRALYSHLDPQRLVEQIRRTVLHEIRHHVETRAGVKDLILEDEESIGDMWRRTQPGPDQRRT